MGNGVALEAAQEGVVAGSIVANLEIQLENVQLGDQATSAVVMKVSVLGVGRAWGRGEGALETLVEGTLLVFGVEGV